MAILCYYDSEYGRWLSADPLAGKYHGWSPYNYTLDNPLRFIDLDGNYVVSADGKIIFRTTMAENFMISRLLGNIPFFAIGAKLIKNDPSFKITPLDIAGTLIGGGLTATGRIAAQGADFLGRLILNTSRTSVNFSLPLLNGVGEKENMFNIILDENIFKVAKGLELGYEIEGRFFVTKKQLDRKDVVDIFENISERIKDSLNGREIDRLNDDDWEKINEDVIEELKESD